MSTFQANLTNPSTNEGTSITMAFNSNLQNPDTPDGGSLTRTVLCGLETAQTTKDRKTRGQLWPRGNR